MSKKISKVSVECNSTLEVWEFKCGGWICDEDDFISTDLGATIFEYLPGDLDVSVECGVYGEGESENATDEEVRELTDEFIDKFHKKYNIRIPSDIFFEESETMDNIINLFDNFN